MNEMKDDIMPDQAAAQIDPETVRQMARALNEWAAEQEKGREPVNITVEYTLDPDTWDRVKDAADEINFKKGLQFTPESFFRFMMRTGCKHDVEERLHYWDSIE